MRPHPPSSTRYVNNLKKSQLYTCLGSAGHLVLPSLISVTRSVHNSRKTQLYTLIRLAKAHLPISTYCNSAHNSRKKQSYTYLTYHSRPSHIMMLMQRKKFTSSNLWWIQSNVWSQPNYFLSLCRIRIITVFIDELLSIDITLTPKWQSMIWSLN